MKIQTEKYNELHPQWKQQVDVLIRKICGKSHIAEIYIEDSDIPRYTFKVTVMKFNSVKGWATIGYIRNDLFSGGIWRLTYNPSKKGRKIAGKTGSYG